MESLFETLGEILNPDNSKMDYYIDFLSKEKNFKPDRKYFATYEEARTWAVNNFEKFDADMIKANF